MFRFFYNESFLENVHLVHVLQLTYVIWVVTWCWLSWCHVFER